MEAPVFICVAAHIETQLCDVRCPLPNQMQLIYSPHSFSIHLQCASMKTQPFNQKRCRFRLKFSSCHYVIFLFLSRGYIPQLCSCQTNALPLKYSLSSLSLRKYSQCIAQAGLQFSMYPRLICNVRFSCLNLLSAKITVSVTLGLYDYFDCITKWVVMYTFALVTRTTENYL